MAWKGLREGSPSLLGPIIARTMLGTRKSLKLVSVLSSRLKDAKDVDNFDPFP